ncbi:hypothetical protein M3Y95_01048900 [Aphelenchoides besseyi]|nr:hypothetical protein M3Y95_01048900 [Aphelenchoides besseyi]
MMNMNDYINSRIDVWGHEADFIEGIRFVNKIVVYFLSPISTLLLFYMILFKSPVLLRSYRFVLLFANIIDCLQVVHSCFISFLRAENSRYFLFITWSDLPQVVYYTVFGFNVAASVIESATVLVEFWFRHVLIGHNSPPSLRTLISMCTLAILLSASSGLFFVVLCVANEIENEFVKTTNSQTVFTFVVKNRWVSAVFIYRRFLTIALYVLTILIAILSFRTLRRKAFTASTKSKKMLDDFTLSLYLKSIAPAFTLFLPMFIRYATERYHVEAWLIDEFTNSMNFWIPFINSTLTLLLITQYRRTIVHALQRLCFKSNRIQTASTTTVS